MSTSQAIHTNAQYHSDLLQTLASIEYAPSALAEQTRYLQDLRGELTKVKEKVEGLSEKTKKERKEHEDLRDSMVRRMASRVVGKKEKFEAKKQKEEREYIEALETEMRERGNQSMLEEMIVEAATTKLDLQEKSDRLKLVQQELSNLYETVFGGPTQEFPRDDQLESQLKSAQETYDSIQAHLNSNSQAVNLLDRAEKMMQTCLNHMNDALGYSTWDMYGGGTISDMMERNALSNAAMTASKAELLMQQAQRASPLVQPIPPLRVHDISMIGDVFFDNIFSDMAAHNKIERNKEELTQAHKRLKSELRAAKARAQQTGADLLEASEVLSECRNDLERFRRETFERVGGISSPNRSNLEAGGGSSESLPPTYERSATLGTPIDPVNVRYPPPSGPPPGHPGAEETPVYQPPLGPPPPHGSEMGQNPMSMPTPSLNISFASAGGSGTRPMYQPPPGPPPGHQNLTNFQGLSTSSLGPSRTKEHTRSLSAGSNKDLPGLPRVPSELRSGTHTKSLSVGSNTNVHSGPETPIPSSSFRTSHSQSTTYTRSPSIGSNKGLPALPLGTDSSSEVPRGSEDSSRPISTSSPSTSHVPTHWGSRK
ncbi:hypothetical protein K435DRAFT_279692 [Dendrothele bispora CBS 962.96]|uniref:Uncharacterized protein n=1 Tax=Dendrothele bispora (strain CBS 962.96) TaxID=1314807 RepID=A0A4S8ML32_DENBC|nr:hypothetical protein K435DRAFT_279692 [Dendrothele bispora CBS 962.96]